MGQTQSLTTKRPAIELVAEVLRSCMVVLSKAMLDES